ncbi:MAG: hypothetical protein K1X78_21715 [Verrucomicrobiaceae bacterium]|nr:hypothetical protein [Verrucomicrobiaceae bacterium]
MIQKILATVLIVAALYGSYVLFMEHQERQRQSRNPWVARMAPLIKLHLGPGSGAGVADGAKAGESTYLAIVYQAWEAAENGYNATDTVKQAAAAAGADAGEVGRIGSSVHENMQFAKSMGVFSSPPNAMKMERGEPPVITAKGWEDEPLVVTNILSPVLAPEAAFAIPNLRLVPESVRNITTERVNAATVELARKFLNERVIYPETRRAIEDKARQQQR